MRERRGCSCRLCLRSWGGRDARHINYMCTPDACRAQDADAGAAGLLFSTLPSFAGGALGFALAPHRFGEATFNVTDTSVSPVPPPFGWIEPETAQGFGILSLALSV